ncbi:hypothetical protein PAEVO_28530 [Paenibacillus sp. GM2FR]|uniref:hypothetical protein n=1 Tax=Paenibacillus sp. GM2FR TaxID=2059268 RepID=UPI000C27A2F0|nr:hypothetical protein [Paenibacillus sp. GM2FR]PJN56130.1 hypothetical protein PAEVO_28530 [Paenibacillus sp. GM2FR]
MEKFFNSIDANAWIQTFGGIAGGLLAGGIAIYLFKRQAILDAKRNRINELQNFVKSYYVIDIQLSNAAALLGIVLKLMDMEEGEYKEKQINEQLSSLRLCLASLNNINDDYIPQEIYRDFLAVKSWLDLNIWHLDQNEGNGRAVFEPGQLAGFFDKYREKISSFGEEKSKELEKLLKKYKY